MTTQWEMTSKICPLFLVASDKGLTGVYWKKQDIDLAKNLNLPSPALQIIKQTITQLDDYFAGKRKSFDIPMDAQGTPFQIEVWEQLKKIPYGQTCSYGAIATQIKNKKAVRAVGAANGKNPISIIVPCHRVIGASGKLTGFAGGLDIKLKLLSLEKEFL